MADVRCPLAPCVIERLPSHTRMNLARVMEIEQHVASAGPCIHPPLKNLVLHGFFEGNTPLLHACEEGHLEAVKHIVKVWGVDVRATGIHYRTHGITPLFVAAHQGHSDIVQYLISEGADVSAVTSTSGHPSYAGLTPLHAALMRRPYSYIYDQSFSEKCVKGNIIVGILLEAGADPSTLASDGTPVWMMEYCGVDATIALVNHGLDLSLVNWKGETILHYWSKNHDDISEEDRLNVVRLLVNRGADLRAQDDAGFTPILASADSYTCDVFDLLFEEDVLDREQQIDALELAGSYLLLATNQEKGYNCWRRALQLREESPPIKKVPLTLRSGQTVEWVTLTELENVIEDPSTYWRQCLFTQFRVYSGISLKAVAHSLSDHFLRLAEFETEDPDEFEEGGGSIPNPEEHPDQDVVTVMWGYLETILCFSPFDAEDHDMIHTAFAVRELTKTLPSLLPGDPLRNVLNIQIILELIVSVMQGGTPSLSYEFFAVLAGLPFTSQNPNIRELLANSARHYADTLIPIACNKEDWDTLRLLLHLGADPKTPGWFGHVYTPLHVLATRDETPARSAAANLLFYYGANPLRINYEGETAVDIWMKKNCGEEGMQSAKWSQRPDWCRDTVPKLSRLCIKSVHIHGVPFDESDASLPPFQEWPNSV